MNLWFRMLYFFLTWRSRSRLDFFDEAATPFRTWPTDLDMNVHMNNGVYLSLMDIGRFDLVFRNGLSRVLKREKWYPVVASQTIRYRKSLAPFQKFEIKSQLLGWDEKFFYIRQKFESKGELTALAVVKAAFLKKGERGIVDPLKVAQACGHTGDENHLPSWAHQWIESEHTHWQSVID